MMISLLQDEIAIIFYVATATIHHTAAIYCYDVINAHMNNV